MAAIRQATIANVIAACSPAWNRLAMSSGENFCSGSNPGDSHRHQRRFTPTQFRNMKNERMLACRTVHRDDPKPKTANERSLLTPSRVAWTITFTLSY
jgi:hypothetical protein